MIHTGVVEDINDPLMLGRVKVRVFGLHTDDLTLIPTESLPWAQTMQPVESASVSGIGISPTGLLRGAWVCLYFLDEEQQYPVIIGSLPGIPKNQFSSNTPYEEEFFSEIISSTVPQEDTVIQSVVKKPSAIKISDSGISHIKGYEKLASLVKGQVIPGSDSTPPSTTIFSYQDAGGKWTIGWGNTTLADGSEVGPNTVLSKRQCDVLFEAKIKEFENAVSRNLKTPVTQSMFDALVSIAYNSGISGLITSSMFSSLNSGKYEDAYALIVSTRITVGGKPSSGLFNRRKTEQILFIKDGLPSKDSSVVSQPTEETQRQPQIESISGFKDPLGIYPKKDWLNEPDTHRLARHQNIDNTIVVSKESGRVRNVKSANDITWDQPPVPYNAKYPYNHVTVTESGHVEEWDDTPGNERIHVYHRTGTFEEIDLNGSKVVRIVGDSYEILERNGHVLIKGSCDVTIQGNSRIRVENDAYVQVLGNSTTEVSGDINLSAKGSLNLKGESINIESYGGDITSIASGNVIEEGSEIHMNSSIGTSVGLQTPTEQASGPTEFSVLTVPTRNNEVLSIYELPEDGDPDEFIDNMVAEGKLEKDDAIKDDSSHVQETSVTPKVQQEPSNVLCDLIFETQRFTSDFKLTDSSTLGDVCRGSSGIPNGINYGKSSQEIVCNLKHLTVNVIDPIRKVYPNMIITNSWRSQRVNDSLKGASKTSQHLVGQAVDIQFSGFDRQRTFEAAIEIQKLLPTFDQMLLEYFGRSMWIHVSFKASGANRNEVRTIDVLNPSRNIKGAFRLYS